MKTDDSEIWEMFIDYHPGGVADSHPRGAILVIKDYKAWREIAEAFNEGPYTIPIRNESERDGRVIRLPKSNPILLRIVAVLTKCGFEPFMGHIIPPAQIGRRFCVLRPRNPFPKPKPPEYAVLQYAKGIRGVFDSWEGDTLLATQDSASHAAKLLLGRLSASPETTVNAPMREAMIQEKLIGVAFEPVKFLCGNYKRRKVLDVPLWRIRATVTLPWSLNPRASTSPSLPDALIYPGDPVPEDCGEGMGFHDDGWYPAIIRYSRPEFEKMPPFDLAQTKENILRNIKYPDRWYHPLILSPRFRQFLNRMKVPVVCTPIKLVD